jgi:thiol-disulfide isomerase/thioredoxin
MANNRWTGAIVILVLMAVGVLSFGKGDIQKVRNSTDHSTGNAVSDLSVPPVVIDFFYEAGCPDCQKVKSLVLPELNERFEGFYVLHYNDVGEKDVIGKLFAYQEKLGITENAPVCMVVDYKYVFNGFAAIQKGLLAQIDECVAARMAEGWVAPEPIEDAANAAETLDVAKRRSQGFTLGMVTIAGLTDGINPCAIASLVFLMSMLRLSKNAGKGLLVMGASYCLAAFLTYIAIGFGLLRVLHLMDQFESMQRGIEVVMLGILAVLAFLSFRDAYRFKVGGNPDAITLQLPKGVKARAHKIMREGLKARSLIVGGVTIGVLVTGLETVCTGQVLVPTLVVVIRESGQPARELLYLLLYNAMFILPLVVIFILTYYGLTTEALMAWSKKNVVFSKVLLGFFFVAMGVLLAVL